MPKRIVKHRYFAEIVDTYVVDVKSDDEMWNDDALATWPYSFIHGKEPRERKIDQDEDQDEDFTIEDMGVLDEIVEAVEQDDAEVR